MITTTTLDPRGTLTRERQLQQQLLHVLDEVRSTDRVAVSLCGRRATWVEHGGSAHHVDAAADCVVCRELDRGY